MKNYKLFFLAFGLMSISLNRSNAQAKVIQMSKVCSFSYNKETEHCESVIPVSYELLGSLDSLERSVKRVLYFNALHETKMEIGVLNNSSITGIYCKSVGEEVPKILIGRTYKDSYWIAIGILLHELGHLLNHHENLCSNPALETDADIFAGRCLAFLKATKEESLLCLSVIDDSIKSSQYPTKEQRKVNILTGYGIFLNSIGIKSFTSINPLVKWEKKPDRSYEITINDKKIKVPYLDGYSKIEGGFIDPNMGILYLTELNATYSLINYTAADKGMGQLVNDRTSLAYIRTGRNSYKIFDKAKIVLRSQKKDTIEKSANDADYEIYIKGDANDEDYKKIALVDYFYTPSGVLRPAFFQ